jgi:hypothetical protein
MSSPRFSPAILISCLALSLAIAGCFAGLRSKPDEPANPLGLERTPPASDAATVRPSFPTPIEPAPLDGFVTKGIEWLVEAQSENGGWGAGSHANQGLRDPHAVQVDPATTAFATMALLRAGHTPVSGRFQASVRRAVEHLCAVVENAPAVGPRITTLDGTQPQAKLGQLIDTMMTVRTLSRALSTIPADDPLRGRVDGALDRALAKLQGSQEQNGSWGGGTWAGVLQSALGCAALEYAQAAGKTVAPGALAAARDHQKGNFSLETGRAGAADSAGIELYAQAGSQRGAAAEAKEANELIAAAKARGELPASAPVDADSLRRIGVDADRAEVLADANARNDGMIVRLKDESILAGFGSNGGEEYLSYLLTSESMFLAGGASFGEWDRLIRDRLAAIQCEDGSWTGHHCITSPVFCTAAVVQCLTTDRDVELLAKIGAGVGETAKR